MKNIIVIDAENNCRCDLLSVVNDGTNRLFLNIKCDISKNPIIEILDETIKIDDNDFLYEISDSIFVGEGYFTFRVLDDFHTGEYFQINKVVDLSGGLSLKQISDFVYSLFICVQNNTGVPIATHDSLGVIKAGATMNITRDGTLNAVEGQTMTPITNLQLEEMLK